MNSSILPPTDERPGPTANTRVSYIKDVSRTLVHCLRGQGAPHQTSTVELPCASGSGDPCRRLRCPRRPPEGRLRTLMPLRCEGPDACSEPSLFLRRTFTPPIAGYNGPPVPSSAVDLHAVYLAAHSAAVPSVARAPAAGFGFEVLTTSKPWIYILRKAPPPKIVA